ncbi:HPP family protein [Alkalihalobacterium alkalinitrilicum]|uniref:HPP family protein n=1 Tax=Alkalihalobacterium alkalinitrilicum TaxID=427920 RepID=UPI00114DE4B5|nr:HPP family protein [Alkalihalobacterium alkalinitrilicum]
MDIQKELNKENNHQFNTLLSSYFTKMKGERKSEPSVQIKENLISATGGLIAMLVISVMAVTIGFPMVLGPMGASCLLVFAAHAGPFSQPRHILGGHFISTIVALSIWDIFGRTHLKIEITLAVVLFLMVVSKMLHPPAAASAIVAINTEAGWGFLLTILISAIILIAISVAYNNLFKNR